MLYNSIPVNKKLIPGSTRFLYPKTDNTKAVVMIMLFYFIMEVVSFYTLKPQSVYLFLWDLLSNGWQVCVKTQQGNILVCFYMSM